jgi:hypothetical protein
VKIVGYPLLGEKNGSDAGTKLNIVPKNVLGQKKLPGFNLETFLFN